MDQIVHPLINNESQIYTELFKMHMDNLKSLLKLSFIEEIPPKLFYFLVTHFKEAKYVYQATERDFNFALSLFKSTGGNYKGDIYGLLHKNNNIAQSQLNRTLDWLDIDGNAVLTIFEDDYPELLKKLPDPPVLLYLSGKKQTLKKPCIAIVGSRKSSYQSNFTSRSFAKGIANNNYCVVSGLARGIDSNAHIGALSSQKDLSTIAVLGSGLDIIYPKENVELAEQVKSNGLLISEFGLGSDPKPFHFPARNRIIAGLSLGVVVVEAAQKSGSLYTAELAMANGRDVFAVPGSVLTNAHKGCHNLIQQGAMLADSAEFVMNNIAWGAENIEIHNTLGYSEITLSPHPLDSIGEQEFTINDLRKALDMPLDSAIEQLVLWETEGRITRLSTGNYQKSYVC